MLLCYTLNSVKLGRILLAGLAPLFSLSAVAAGWMTSASAPADHVTAASFAHSLPRLLSVVEFVLAGVDQAQEHLSPEHRTPHAAVFSLEALVSTPFQGSLWLVGSLYSVDLHQRRHAYAPLRC